MGKWYEGEKGNVNGQKDYEEDSEVKNNVKEGQETSKR